MSIFLFIERVSAMYHYFTESTEQLTSFNHYFSHSQDEREITHTHTHTHINTRAPRADPLSLSPSLFLSDSSLESSIIPEFMSLGSSMASGFSNKQSGNVLHQSSKEISTSPCQTLLPPGPSAFYCNDFLWVERKWKGRQLVHLLNVSLNIGSSVNEGHWDGFTVQIFRVFCHAGNRVPGKQMQHGEVWA